MIWFQDVHANKDSVVARVVLRCSVHLMFVVHLLLVCFSRRRRRVAIWTMICTTGLGRTPPRTSTGQWPSSQWSWTLFWETSQCSTGRCRTTRPRCSSHTSMSYSRPSHCKLASTLPESRIFT